MDNSGAPQPLFGHITSFLTYHLFSPVCGFSAQALLAYEIETCQSWCFRYAALSLMLCEKQDMIAALFALG